MKENIDKGWILIHHLIMEDPAKIISSSMPTDDPNQISTPSTPIPEPPMPPPPTTVEPPLTTPEEVPLPPLPEPEPKQLEETPLPPLPPSVDQPLVFRKSGEPAGSAGSKPKKPFLIGGAILIFLIFSVALATYLGQKGKFGATPTPSRSVAPELTATSTPGSLPACLNVQVTVAGGGSLDSLKVGDSLTFAVSFGGTVEDVGVVIKKEGIRVKTLTAGSPQTNSWTSLAYTIESLGSYEISAYVKINGVWQ